MSPPSDSHLAQPPRSKSTLVFSVIQILCGIALLISDIFSFVEYHAFEAVMRTGGASGIWIGIFFVITGGCGIVAYEAAGETQLSIASLRRHLQISLILSILATIAAFSFLIYFGSLIGSGTYVNVHNVINQNGYSIVQDYHSYLGYGDGPVPANLCFHLLMFLFSLIQAVFTGLRLRKLPHTIATTTVSHVMVPVQHEPAVLPNYPPAAGYYGHPMYPNNTSAPGHQGQAVQFQPLQTHPGPSYLTH
ncbi:uncharacterized protein LOC129592689 [Paramacrobiotus metropolitanus]|uniref:uncharacterized protein LOC129592689 n=1 Tax=Paramacrobiotus metropolitanus TaxID=2943436 RepID=UPI0024464CD7|nr:uncharacterized protein LOC129592689 [Paramacrobiotus metropolitanus]